METPPNEKNVLASLGVCRNLVSTLRTYVLLIASSMHTSKHEYERSIHTRVEYLHIMHVLALVARSSPMCLILS